MGSPKPAGLILPILVIFAECYIPASISELADDLYFRLHILSILSLLPDTTR